MLAQIIFLSVFLSLLSPMVFAMPSAKTLSSLETKKSYEGLYKLSSGRTLNVKFNKGQPGKPFVYLIHGLGDEIKKMNPLAQEMRSKGWNILRVDTALSGQSLKYFIKDNKIKSESDFSENFRSQGYDYNNNVDDLVEIALQTNERELLIIGHSYGGAMAWEVRRRLLKDHSQRVQVKGTVMIAPYLQRIDKYVREKLGNRTVVVDLLNRQKGWAKNVNTLLKSCGMWWLPDTDAIEEMYEPFEDALFQKLQTNRTVNDFVNDKIGKDKFVDQVVDPMTDSLIKKSYADYFKKAYPNESAELTAIRAQAAMSLTIGIRSFDLLNYSQHLDLENTQPILIIRGQFDNLVKDTQVADFAFRLKERNPEMVKYKIITETVKGQPPGHLIPQTHAPQVMNLILDYAEAR